MNNFRRSVAEVVQVVKIADSTVRKRLEEFRRTGSAGFWLSLYTLTSLLPPEKKEVSCPEILPDMAVHSLGDRLCM